MENEVDYSPFGEDAPLIDPEDLPKWLLSEDNDLLVFNKPGWLVCHPSKNGPWSSLVGAVREMWQLDATHLISRLDRETSGLIIFAKHRKAASQLQVAFAKRNTRKTYKALLVGHLKEERTTDSNLDKDSKSAVVVKQAISFGRNGKPAITHFKPIETWGNYTLVEVTPITGRKHQIRAHAEWLGYPVAGDKIYGGHEDCYLEFIEKGWTERIASILKFPRQALHAETLEVWGDDWSLSFSAPCPFIEEGYRKIATEEASETLNS